MRQKKSAVRTAFGSLKGIVAAMTVISGTANLLALTGSFYMLQVYDRVLSSQSISTLVALSVLALALYMFQGALEIMRSQILVRLGGRLDDGLTEQAHKTSLRLSLLGRKGSDAQQPMRDVETIRGFLSGQGPLAIIDMPWMPLFLIFIFLLHPVLGWITTGGAVALVGLTLMTEHKIRAPSLALVQAASRRLSLLDANTRNAEVLRAMGFAHRAMRRFSDANSEHLAMQQSLVDLTSGFSSVSRVIRMILQSALLGAGAYFTIKGEMSAGAIIACSIAASRAYAPIELAIANWKGFVAARQSATRLEAAFVGAPEGPDPLELSAPIGKLNVDNISVVIPGTQRAVIQGVGFELNAGEALAVIGQSAAGKSSLARALVGVWDVARGSIRLDGASLDSWSNERLGQHIGYLPQDVELFDGTITENISRFDEEPDSMAVVSAARAAGVHELILRLPEGYETMLGERGQALSAGQRQRIALARALYRDPFFVVLDEPNSNLDSDGEEALALAIRSVRERKGIAIVIAHRSGILAAVDKVAVIGNGQLTAFGPRDEVLRKAVRPPPAAAAVVSHMPRSQKPA
ncbi:MAG: type I secretion system permease/ATPase [Hyphomicrobium sp.]